MPPLKALRRLIARARRLLLPDGTPRQQRYHALRVAFARWWQGPPIPALPRPATLKLLSGADLSVIVIALDAQPELVGAVRSLHSQRPRPEIVVVNSGAQGAATLLSPAGPDVTVVESSRRLFPGAARNVGIAAAHGTYVAFLAADCTARPGWVASRLESHRAGAAVVSSPVVNANPWNPFSAAAHILLFASRLPGGPAQRRSHYGASYLKTLFSQHGFFSNDLRAGEDTEFNRRLPATLAKRFDARVQTAHRNPRTPWALLMDQYQRGHRRSTALRAIGVPAPLPGIWQAGFRRSTALATTALRLTRGRSWLPLLCGLPWIYPASVAYALGLGSGARATAPLAPLPPPRRLVALLQFHNDHAYLPGYLENVSEHVDGIVVLDDGSTPPITAALRHAPKVLEVLQLPARSPHVWNERRNQRLLIDCARRHRAEWLLALDTDERLESDFRKRAEPYLDAGDTKGVTACSLILRELWGSPNSYRADGIWGTKRRPRLFKPRDDHRQGDTELHSSWAALDAHGKRTGFVPADLIIYHLAMITPEQRQARLAKYQRLDPGRISQKRGYDYFLDETGLRLAEVAVERGYRP